MCIQARFVYTRCGHKSEWHVRPCSVAFSCRRLSFEVDIPWYAHSYCNNCFAPEDDSNPNFGWGLEIRELLPEQQERSKAIFRSFLEHQKKHFNSLRHFDSNNLKLFTDAPVQMLEELADLSRLLEHRIEWDAQRVPAKFHTLGEKRLVVQLREAAQNHVVDIFFKLPRTTTSTPNAIFLGMDDENQALLYQRTILPKLTGAGRPHTVITPCQCTRDSVDVLFNTKLQKEDACIENAHQFNHYRVYKWFTICDEDKDGCGAKMTFLEVADQPVESIDKPAWFEMLMGGINIPLLPGEQADAESSRPSLARRATVKVAKTRESLIRRLTNLGSQMDGKK
ncbi:hypothetical protein BDZ45DRAFT_789297 [Acephala macrosclerotiorum]|nr:hypothetical protein BDZ45DRAFT_789297 [Acephala macrosclerotiorum]